MKKSIQETSEQLTLWNCQKQTLSAVDFHAQLSALLAKEQDFPRKTQEVRSFMKSSGWLKDEEFLTFYLRMSKDCLTTTMEEVFQSSLLRWMNLGMIVNGNCLTAKISESRKTGSGCSLSDILEENPDPKYFLSEKQVKRMMDRTKENEKNGRGFAPTFVLPSTSTTTKAEQADPTQSNNGDEDSLESSRAMEHQP